MKYLIVIALLFITSDTTLLVDFNSTYDSSKWVVVDDVVMGGRSDGHFEISPDGHGVFSGDVSLENNGGFSSVRYRLEKKSLSSFRFLLIRLKGDGKRYQFRIKSSRADRHSFIHYFQTSGKWQEIKIPLGDMKPSFRGMMLDMPNYDRSAAEELAFLIANYKNESFHLEIDNIQLK